MAEIGDKMSAGGDGRNMGLSSEIGIGTRIWLARAADAMKSTLLRFTTDCPSALKTGIFC